MKTAYLTFIATTAVWWWPHSLRAQVRALSVCQALNSAADHQRVLIHAAIASTQHQTYLFEGNGRDPCPGWRKRFFTAPSAIPIVFGSYSGVHVSDNLLRDNLEFVQRLKGLQKADPSALRMVKIGGVLIRKRWTLVFRRANQAYVGWGEGLDGGSAALLVVTSAAIEDR
jgi:hypothetical protein